MVLELNKISVAKEPLVHAHLLAIEMNGQKMVETPEAVMQEVEFRTTHISSLMEEMFEAAKNRDWFELDEP